MHYLPVACGDEILSGDLPNVINRNIKSWFLSSSEAVFGNIMH